MSESRTVAIVPLNRSNYPTWKLQCKMAIIRDGVWGIVNGSEQAPEGGSDAYRIEYNNYNKTIKKIPQNMSRISKSI